MIEKNRFWVVLFIVLAIFTHTSCSTTKVAKNKKDKCLITRAAFDIGSGTTKLKVGKVNICEQKLTEVIFEKNIVVKYKEDLTQNGLTPKQLSTEILEKGLDSLRTLKDEADRFSPDEYIGVATSAFREAVNAPSYMSQISAELGINARTITQKQEGILGFIAGSTQSNKNLNDLIVWDIGGGSMQIVGFDQGEFIVYEGDLAAVSFKNIVLEKIKNKNPSLYRSPNPLKFSQALQGKNLAKIAARNEIPKSLKNKFNDPKLEVIGIGGVHYYSIKNQSKTNSSVFTLGQVERALQKRSGLTDEELDSSYAETEVTNISLVLGFMEELKINQVRTAKINLADGLLASGEMIFKNRN